MANDARGNILLESGTNEIEIMEFTIDGNAFGINVAKVDRILMPVAIKEMPHAHSAVEGVIKPRDSVMTLINLPRYLGLTESEDKEKNLFIVTNFNKLNIAFRVHGVVGISRISWEAIQKPDKTIYGGTEGVATGLAQIDGRLVTILDFERIIGEIAPETAIQVSEIDKLGKRSAIEHHIVMAEDSVLLARMMEECLHKAGYRNVTRFDNGEEAWNFLSSIRDREDLYEQVSLVITDIEMPRMDGHHLLKLIKTDKRLGVIPVVIFSSLINDQMYQKGKQLGADEQLTKPEIAHLVEVIDHLITKSKG